MHLVEAVSRERGILEVQFGSQRVRQVHGASFEWIVAASPSLSHELCSQLTDAPSGGSNS